MASLRKLLILGATGKQGRATIQHVNNLAPGAFEILALTRDKTSPQAQKLAKNYPKIQFVEGNTQRPQEIFQKTGPVWGALLVLDVSHEEAQNGIAFVDAAIAAGVEYLVYASVDRGGPKVSDTEPTYVPHFAAKFQIEQHLKKAAAASPQKMQWHILRPVAFMDNLSPGFPGSSFATVWRGIKNPAKNNKLQVVATEDIGFFAAKAFQDPKAHAGQAVSIVGDELTFAEANAIFKEEIGHPMKETFGLIVTVFSYVAKDFGMMFRWFSEFGFGASVQENRKLYPELTSWRTWVQKNWK